MKVIGYTRVSTAEQASDGVSLAAQADKLRQYAALYDLELVGIIEDAGGSAKSLDRTGIQQALGMLRSGEAEGLLIAKLDRLTRSVADMDTLIREYFGDRARHHVALLSVGDQIDTTTAAGRLVLNVLMSVAQWEREAIGERTSTALQHKKRLGELVGSVPYGYVLDADGVHLVAHAGEQAVIAAVLELHHAGLSLRRIADALQARGYQSRGGGVFHAQTVSNILKEAKAA